MRFKLNLQSLQKKTTLPFNYQYPLSAAIYKIIQAADAGFASFLHNTGYGGGHKSFKLFTFSDISTRFIKDGDRMQLRAGEAELIVCFYMPQAAENFIKGLFMNQQLEVADIHSRAIFNIAAVESLPDEIQGRTSVLLQPLSPMVVGKKNSRGHYDYRSPQDGDFGECLYHNWIEKCLAAGVEPDILDKKVYIDVLLLPYPPQSRLITIKGGTVAETKIRGFTKFRLRLDAPEEMLEVAMGAGLGLHNAQGMGCVAAASG